MEFNYNEIKNLYIDDDVPAYKIAKQLGCSDTTLGKYLKSTGLISAKKPWINPQNIQHKLDAGYQPHEIAREFGCDTTIIQKSIKRHGLMKISIDDDYVRELYDSGLSSNEISNRIGWSKPTVLASLHETGGVRNYSINDDVLNLLNDRQWLEEQLQNKSIRELMREIGCSNVISYYMNKYSISSPISTSSLPERIICDILDELGIEYIRNDRSIIYPLELDFYIPEYKIAIEANGIYWHSEIYKDRLYHKNKFDACVAAGITLFQFYDVDILTKSELIAQSIKVKCGISTNSIYARKCKVADIKPSIANDFLDKTHIQGSVHFSKFRGLLYDGYLVAVLGYKEHDTDIEITRYSSNNRVIGGFSKLLKSIPFNSAFTFSDNMYSTGKLYEACGFQHVSNIPPDYKYIHEGKLHHKFLFRKKRFKNDPELKYVDGKTERELAEINNLIRLYDSGKKKFILNGN